MEPHRCWKVIALYCMAIVFLFTAACFSPAGELSVNDDEHVDNTAPSNPDEPTNNNTSPNDDINDGCDFPRFQLTHQPCCTKHGESACISESFCAAFDGQPRATCQLKHSRKDEEQCREDEHCQSKSCHSTLRLCRSAPQAACSTRIGCSQNVDGLRYLCVDNVCQRAEGYEGDVCATSQDCASQYCVHKRCTAGEEGDPCTGPQDCISEACDAQEKVCMAYCPDDRKLCGLECVDLQTDRFHCNECNNQCPQGRVCLDGQCGCPSGESVCSGQCVNMATDKNNCGECLKRCNSQCADGQCADAVQIAAGGGHSCALLKNGLVRCWGYGDLGQLGDGRAHSSPRSVKVSNLSDVEYIVSGASHTCALLSDNTVQCWGNNEFGQVGIQDNVLNSFVPSALEEVHDVIQLSAGANHTCLLFNSGHAQCWGDNQFGQLGTGDHIGHSTPVSVSGLSNVTQISAGGHHSCALLSDGTVRCWGSGQAGQLGAGNQENSPVPVVVNGLNDVTQIASGFMHTCALLSDHTVRCWGEGDSGQLGDGFFVRRTTPQVVENLSGVLSISVGIQHSCAMLANGTAKCWGGNEFGQLGAVGMGGNATPIEIPNLNEVTQLSAGMMHTCVVLSNYSAKCWGHGEEGQLGDGNTTMSADPVTVQF